MVRFTASRSETERHQTALRGRALTRSRARTALPDVPSLWGNVGRGASEPPPCRRAGNAKRRARPPRGDDRRPGRRRGNRDPRALLVWPGCLPRRLQLVCTRSSGRNSLFFVAPSMWVQSRTDSFGFDGDSSATGLGANPTVGGVGRVPQRDAGVKPHKTVSKVAVVVSAPVRPGSSPGRAQGSSWLLRFTSGGTS